MNDRDTSSGTTFWGDVHDTEARERFQTLVNVIDDGIFQLDGEDRVVAVNDVITRTTGYTREELLGEHIASLSEGEPASTIEHELDRLDPTPAEPATSLELTVETASNGAVHWDVRLNPIVEDGAVQGVIGIARDIDEQDEHERAGEEPERRETRRELRESEAKFRMLAENLKEIVWMATEDAEEFIYLNPAFEEVWGLERRQLYDDPLSFLDAVHPEDRERVREGFTGLPEREFDDEFRVIRPDGEMRWIHSRGARVHDDEGMARVIGLGEDVTERKEREAELEESERLYQTLAQNFPNGAVGIYNDDLRYDLVEGAMWDDIEPDAEDLEGKTIREVFSDDVVADIEPVFRAAIDRGETNDVLTELIGRTLRVWATPLRDSDGEIFAGLSFAQDITEQKERERKLAASERRYRTLAENIPNGAVGLVDRDMRYVTIGGSPLTDRDLLAADLEGRPIEEALSPELTEALAPRYRAALHGESSTLEYEHAGGERYTRYRTFPVRNDEGDVFAAMGMSQDITDQVEREAELERTLDLFHKTERIADVGGWEVDVDTKDVFWTEQIFDLLEVDADEEPSLDEALDMYHEEDQPIVEDAIEDALADGEPFEAEARIESEGGGIRWLRLQGVPETDDGGVTSLRGAALDITDRKEREQFLREMQEIAADSDRTFEQKLQAMFELGCERFDMELGGLASIDPATDYFEIEATNGDHEHLRPGEEYPLSETYCREASPDRDTRAISDPDGFEDRMSYEHFGLQSYLGTYLELDGAADRSFWFASSEPQEGGFSETARRYHHQMGQWIRYELERRHHTDQLAAINRLNAVARDINRELAQQSTRDSIESVVCDRLADSESYRFAWVGTVDEEHREIVPSTVSTERPLDDAAGVDYDGQAELGPTGMALRTGEIQVVRDTDRVAEFGPWPRRTHEWGFDTLAAIPIAYEERNYGVLTVYSERPNAFDGEERAVIGQLGEIVGLAIAAVEREQKLEYERERLEFVNRLLRHNLLNGLNAIAAQATILESYVEGEGQRYLETIHERVDDMADLIETMRSLMRIITDEQQELRAVDLGSILRNELRKARKIHRDARFELHGDLDGTDGVRANEAIAEVFENLLVNAVQHNDADTPAVSVTVERDDDRVTVHVADNGPGVPNDLKDRIFEKGEKNFDSPGTGFGLYLAREIIEGCDGEISVSDGESSGAVFSVTLREA